MWYAPATCRYGQTYGWMPQRVGAEENVSYGQGGYTPPSNPDDAGIKKAKDAADVAVKKWSAAYKYAMTYHTSYTAALKANTAAQAAEDAWATAALGAINQLNLNYAEAGGQPPTSLTKPYTDAVAAAQQQHKFLVDGRAFLVADMAAHITLGPASGPKTVIAASPGAQEAAANAVDNNTPKVPGIPPPPVSPEDADDPTKPAPPDAFAGPLEWGQIAGWAAVVGVVGFIFWRTVSGRALA